jgi:uncharacterized protein (UPF0264 family)
MSKTQLLVSVRNAEEARDALEGGAGIIDVKEPGRGSLGAADPKCWQAVVQAVAGRVPVSVALGELSELQPELIDDLPSTVAYAKVGLAGRRHRSNWFSNWCKVVQRLQRVAPVAVVYADWRTCGSPPPREIVAAARDLHCPALLCDTFDKQAGNLFDYLDDRSIQSLGDSVRGLGMMFALAGSVDARHLDALMRFEPDYVAVRGAVCDGDRLGAIRREKVRRLVQRLSQKAFP